MTIYAQLLLLLGMVFFSTGSFAENRENTKVEKQAPYSNQKEKNSQRTTPSKTKTGQPIKYIPPFLGAPATDRLIGMAVRGQKKQHDQLLAVLTPTHTGLTTKAQPTLHWYIANPVSKSIQYVEFVLNSEKSITPVLRTRLDLPKKRGIQKLRLADYDITLEPDVEYAWSIALVADPTTRSHDFVSSGKVKLGSSKSALQKRLKQASEKQYPNLFAQAGFWYDTLTALVKQTEQKPNNQTFRNDLVQLLEQVGLHQVAEQTGGTTMNPG
ncbi:MAG: DUF928 domain-containing protein [Methylococcaceae bacterium]